MKKLTIGILAHVDAGKTTLSEALLYLSGHIRKLGRVDNKDTFLDTNTLERSRGITIFSNQAELELLNTQITLLDTPGHVDFSGEMERTLRVLDYAILLINGADGVQNHTLTLWKLLSYYKIPVFLFVNKMDQPGTDREALLNEIRARLSDNCIYCSPEHWEDFYEDAAVCGENALDQFLSTGRIEDREVQRLIAKRKLFPCCFGSALKLEGIDHLMNIVDRFTVMSDYPADFGGRVFKIARDEQDNRVTYLKVTGGVLKVKDAVAGSGEKVNQIRIYSGNKYETAGEAKAGTICAVTGLNDSRPGDGLGFETGAGAPLTAPVMSYRLILPPEQKTSQVLAKLRQLEEEFPELHIVWDEALKEIQMQIMGEVQLQVLQVFIKERFGFPVEFGTGNIVYKETIANRVEGVGHFEPLKHYAEVHLIIEPGDEGSGIKAASECSEDVLGRNWQRLIRTHLMEKEHKGVLIGAPVTDIKITLATGKAHTRHTEGGDFREATYRALRQGLMAAESVLLEPYYEYRLEVPEKMIGRAMADIERMNGTFSVPMVKNDIAVLTGSVPAATINDYHQELTSYTKGSGRLSCSLKGYGPCHNTEEVMKASGYETERDVENPSGSIFCAHGAGFYVPWYQVKDYMHLEAKLTDEVEPETVSERSKVVSEPAEWMDTDEVEKILDKTFNANRRKELHSRKGVKKLKTESFAPVFRSYKAAPPKEEYLLVDGYNIIFAWKELRELAEDNIDAARGKLQDILCNYQGIKKCHLIIVFDAYRVKNCLTRDLDYHNIHVVYTKAAETADQYIERFAHENKRKYHVTVATSDGLEQIIIRGAGAALMSANDLKEDVDLSLKAANEAYQEKQVRNKQYLLDHLSEDERKNIEGQIR